MKNRNIGFTIMLFAFGSFALSASMQAVLPAPDGGYPGGNTAEGQSALLNLTTGGFNTAIGFFSLRSNTDSSFNTAIGAGALFANTAFNNTATGAGALLSNNTGEENTANGAFALFSNTDGLFNTATGAFALQNNTTGFQNTAIGSSALFHNTQAGFNTAIGNDALVSNTTGAENTAIGEGALDHNTTGSSNTAIGQAALFASSGDNNIAIGRNAGFSVTTASNVICIGHPGADADDSCFIGQIRDAVVAPDAAQVLIDSAGKLGTTSGSSRRFKTDIKAMKDTSGVILAIRPVKFRYKSDKANTPQFGLIAEEVAKVSPDLVVRDKNGNINAVRYDAVNAMLLNEFLKEHKKVAEQAREIREQKAAINRLGKTVEAAVAHIQEEDLKIKRVNEQIEINQVATRRIHRARSMLHILSKD